MNIVELKSLWESFKLENPKVRIRDAAKHLGSSEAELLSTSIGTSVTRLSNDFQQILKEVEVLGKVMALTRNDFCVHERKGVYSNVSFTGPMGLALNPDIDLRLFMFTWASAFAVDENGRRSLQFFAKDGGAIHKIYLTENSNQSAYGDLVNKFRAEDQHSDLLITEARPSADEKPDAEVDVLSFREQWLGLKDTHDFHGLLKNFGLSRTQGLRLAPENHAIQVPYDALKNLLHKVAETELEVMVFTGNKGCIQIHTGALKNLVQAGPWFNVLDPDFNMHLREDGIEAVWLVRKPTSDGIVTSVEVFDAKGEVIVQFFGKRKPGIAENDNWRSLANSIDVVIQ